MGTQVLGKFKDIDSSQQKSLAHRLKPELGAAPAVPMASPDINNKDVPQETDSFWDNEDNQVKEFTTGTDKWMQETHSESEHLARIRSLDALLEGAVKSSA